MLLLLYGTCFIFLFHLNRIERVQESVAISRIGMEGKKIMKHLDLKIVIATHRKASER